MPPPHRRFRAAEDPAEPPPVPPFRVLAVTPRGGPGDPRPFLALLARTAPLPGELGLLLRLPPAPGGPPPAPWRVLAEACQGHGVPLFLGLAARDLPRAAGWIEALGVSGVQLRADPSAHALAAAAAALPPGVLLGGSYHAPPRSLPPGLHYAVLAPVYAPRSSRGKRSMGPEGLAAFARARRGRHPVLVALGGVTPKRVCPLFAAGADAVASITCFFGPAEVVAQDGPDLVRQVRNALARRHRGLFRT